MKLSDLPVKKILPLLILVIGSGIGLWLFTHPQQAKKRPHAEALAFLVNTAQPDFGTYTATVDAMGRIIPAMEVMLKPRVAGEVMMTAGEFIPGGFFAEGETILRIDPDDYDLAVQKQEAILEQAQAALDLEQGRQDIARDELDILARTTGKKPGDTALALRRPQRAQARAEVEKAAADLEIARLNLSRTEIVAPFNALVTTRNVTRGDKVTAAQTLATLVNTDEYWVEVSVPVDQLQWLDIPDDDEDSSGSAAKIFPSGSKNARTGKLLKVTGSLDERSRLATLLVSVPDPLEAGKKDSKNFLIIGDYVRVFLEGKPLQNVARIPLPWLHDNNTVWVMEGARLAIRPVTVVYEDRTYAYIADGLDSADIIVTSDIPMPVEGMRLRTMEEARADVQDKMKGPKGPHEGAEQP